MGKIAKVEQGARRKAGRRTHGRIAMDGPMTIYEAARDKRALLEALGRSAELEIDLSRVTELDTAGIQLLVLAKREAAKANRVVRLTGHSPAALDAIDLYNLGGYFGDPVVISSHKR